MKMNYLKKISDEIFQLNEQFIREKAENENIRRRFEKELDNTRKFAISDFVKNLIEEVENLFRALENINLKNCDNNKKLIAFYEGVNIVKKNILKVFGDYKIKRIYPLNCVFNHQFHEAVSQVVDNKKELNTVVTVIQAGYLVNDRLLRPAMVIVTKK